MVASVGVCFEGVGVGRLFVYVYQHESCCLVAAEGQPEAPVVCFVFSCCKLCAKWVGRCLIQACVFEFL